MIPPGRTSSKLISATLTVLIVAAGIAVFGTATPAGAISIDEASFFDATNAYRQASGLAPLEYDAAASAVARGWSQSMAGSRTLAHNPNLVNAINAYVTPDWTRIGENVGFGPTVSSIQNAFINSPPHLANILGDYNRVGVGVVRDGNNTIWVTIDFVNGPDIAAPGPPPVPMLDIMSPATTSWPSTGRTDVLQRGGDGSIWAKTLVNGAWSSWYSLGGGSLSEPTVSSWSGRLDVFIRGLDNAIWHRALANGTWFPWESLGGQLTSGAGAVSWGTNRIDVYARGLDGAVWSKTWNGTSWTGWSSIGGYVTTKPDVSSWGNGRLDVFAGGGDGSIWHRAFTSGTWQNWQDLGGRVTSGPGAVSWGNNRIDLTAQGFDGATWADSWTGSAWTGWYPLGGGIVGAPDIGAPGSNRLDVVARGRDGAIWSNNWTGTGWTGWWTLG